MEKPPKKKTRVDSPESSSDEKAVNNTTQQDQVPEKEQEFADALTELNHVSDGDEVPNSLPKATSAQPEETPSAQQEETQDAQLEERASDNMNQDAQVENGAQAKLNDTQKSAQQTLKEQREPRLVMKKMVLNNFKSYAGRQVIGPFHKVNKRDDYQ
jgi:structural maintenance of chromosome 4